MPDNQTAPMVRSPVAFDLFRRHARARGSGAARASRRACGCSRSPTTTRSTASTRRSQPRAPCKIVPGGRALLGARRLRGPAHPRLRARPHRPARCWPRSRTSAAIASAASTRWPTTCASAGFTIDAAASTRRPAARTSPTRCCRARREPDARTRSSPTYLVPGTPTYVGRSRPTVPAGDRRHPRRRRPRRLGAPVLGHGRGAGDAATSSPATASTASRRSTPPTTRSRRAALHAAARERGPADHRLRGLPRARA